jgi:hypothetical protein
MLPADLNGIDINMWEAFLDSSIGKCFSDVGFSVYLSTGIICSYGFLLFSLWWWKVGRASKTYGYLTFMYFTLSWVSWNGCYVRWIYANGTFEGYNEFIGSIWWGMPTWMTVGVFILMVGRMHHRMRQLYQPWSLFKMKLTAIISKLLK